MTVRVCLLLALLAPGLAVAKKPTPPAEKAPAAKHLSYDEGDEIEGGLMNPDGTPLTGKRPIKFSSLVTVRTTFVPELLKRAEDQ